MSKEPAAHRALPEPEVYRSCFQVMQKAMPHIADIAEPLKKSL